MLSVANLTRGRWRRVSRRRRTHPAQGRYHSVCARGCQHRPGRLAGWAPAEGAAVLVPHDVPGPSIRSPAARRVPCVRAGAGRRFAGGPADRLRGRRLAAFLGSRCPGRVLARGGGHRRVGRRTMAALDYAHAGYQLDGDGLKLRRGVLWQIVTHVPRSRVQHTDVSQGPLERRYGSARWSSTPRAPTTRASRCRGWRTRSREPCATSFAPSGPMTTSEQRLHPASILFDTARYAGSSLCRRCWRSSPAAAAAGRGGGTARASPTSKPGCGS